LASLFRRRLDFFKKSLFFLPFLGKGCFCLFILIMKKILIRLPALLIAGFIWFLSSQSILPQPKGILGWDKLQHLLIFGALAAAIGFWIPAAFWKRRPGLFLLITMLAGSGYGAIDELHQYFVPGRDSNVWDWIADTLGSFLGALAVMLLMKKNKSGEIKS
jgi:VanZ family protein